MRSSLVAKGDFAYELKKVENQWYPMLSVPHLKRKFLTLIFFDFLAKMLLEKFCSKSYPNIIGSIFATSCRKVLLDPNPPLGTLLQDDFASFDLGFSAHRQSWLQLKGDFASFFFAFFSPQANSPLATRELRIFFFGSKKIYAKSPCSPRVDH